MLAKISVTAACLVLALMVPALEINETHLLNPHWPSHARLHEAWQLLSNATLSMLCLWLAWTQAKARLASAIMLALTGSFLVAFIARATYGGSMQHTDGSELMMGGVNPAFGVMLATSVALAVGALWRRHEAPAKGRTMSQR